MFTLIEKREIIFTCFLTKYLLEKLYIELMNLESIFINLILSAQISTRNSCLFFVSLELFLSGFITKVFFIFENMDHNLRNKNSPFGFYYRKKDNFFCHMLPSIDILAKFDVFKN